MLVIKVYSMSFMLARVFFKQDFSVALEAVMELALIDQPRLKLTEIHLPLPFMFWN